MVIDRLQTFLGKPHVHMGSIIIHSPTLNEIAEIGEVEYSINILLCSFDKERVLLDLFSYPKDAYLEIVEIDDYEVLTGHGSLCEYICKAYSFFLKQEVTYQNDSFFVDGIEFINKSNYRDVRKIIQELNCLKEKEEQPIKFRNNRAKKMYEKMFALRSKYGKKQDSLELKDMLSILCSAEGNGINIFNVGELTIYQVYEQFERLNVKESHRRLLPAWANGHLSENTKLPEWIVKTNF